MRNHGAHKYVTQVEQSSGDHYLENDRDGRVGCERSGGTDASSARNSAGGSCGSRSRNSPASPKRARGSERRVHTDGKKLRSSSKHEQRCKRRVEYAQSGVLHDDAKRDRNGDVPTRDGYR